jgi:hypothetical protein
MFWRSISLSCLVVSLLVAGCGKGEGEQCNPETYETCGSDFDDTSISCLSCPSSKGYSSVQGVCTTSLSASSTACAEAYSAPGGSGGSGLNCNQAWTCAYDGQATPMCGAACNYTGTQRSQTCQVLASMVTSGNAGECCSVCR